MKFKSMIIISIVLLLFGLLLFLYPSIAERINKKNEEKKISDYVQTITNTDEQVLQKQLETARKYNQDLYEHMFVLTDPFDPNAFPITDEEYEAILNLNEVMAYIEIPSIDVYLPIYHNTDEDTLLKGIGHLENTSVPVGGPTTHTVLTGHTGLPTARLFTDINKLEIGNIFRIYVMGEKLSYKVFSTEIVLPEDNKTLYVKEDEDLATLITCTPYGVNTHRLLVHGTRITEEEEEEIIKNEKKIDKRMEFEITGMRIMIVLIIIFVVIAFIIIFRRFKLSKK